MAARPDASPSPVASAPRPGKARKRREDSFFGLHFDLHPNLADTVLGARVTSVSA